MKPGRLITLEGGDGAGKSSQINPIRDFLSARDIPVIVTRTPGGTPLAEAIRSLILDHTPESPEPLTELLLAFAALRQHWVRVIEPALDSGTWVLCDRFVDSAYPYQGAGRGIPINQIETLENWVLGSRRPDLTFFFETPVEIALPRAKTSDHANRMEQASITWHELVHQGYFSRIKAEPNRFIVVYGQGGVTRTPDEIIHHLEHRLKEWTNGETPK